MGPGELTPPPGPAARFPWGTLAVWAVLAAGLYTLRDALLIAFLTFLLSYLVRSLVLGLAHRLSPGGASPRLERWLTLGTFAGLVLMLWGIGSLVGPQLVGQSRLLLADAQRLDPQATLSYILERTVGAYLFAKDYGSPQDPRYQEGLARFAAEGRMGEGAYAGFGRLKERIDAGFEVAYAGAEQARLHDRLLPRGAAGQQFDQWFLSTKAPALVSAQRAAYLARWKGAHPGSPSLQGADLDRELAALALADLEGQPAERRRLVEEWKDALVRAEWRRVQSSPGFRKAFGSWYGSGNGKTLGSPYDFATYSALADAYPEGLDAFAQVYRNRVAGTPAGLALLDHDFRSATQADLARTWWASSSLAASLRAHVQQDAASVAEGLGAKLEAAAGAMIAIPAQIGTALFLTILVTFDMARLREGAERLRESRIGGIYAQAVPHLVALARLIGRSFAAQGLIALFNTLLSLILFRALGIQSEMLLGVTVFVASFIPVLGVIFSAIPIALQALLQPDGSLQLAIYALLGVAAIHLTEETILSPRIVGKVLHLHPVLVMAVLVVGGDVFGLWGLLLGVPVAVYVIHAGILGESIPGVYDPAKPDST